MKINSRFFIGMDRTSKAIRTNLLSGRSARTYATTDGDYHNLLKILQVCRKRKYDDVRKNAVIIKWLKAMCPSFSDSEIAERLFEVDLATTASPYTSAATASTPAREPDSATYKNIANDIASKLIKFFSEFNYTPSFRYISTLATAKDRQEYTANYFNLQNHSFSKEISDKVKSAEFKDIDRMLSVLTSNVKVKPINSRFDLYFGEPGTGKTTVATGITDTCIVCSSDMLPTDLMQNFAFNDGKAEFQKSDLWKAMEEGTTIVLDEINMLPFESLRFLQGILDGKSSINFKGFHIEISDNFKVIGTMNLNVNGQCIPLPAPLVDRCALIKEYEITADKLASALIA